MTRLSPAWRPRPGTRAATSFQINVTCLMQPVRLPVQRSVTNRSNEGNNDIIVDVARLDPTGARIPGKAGQANMGAPARETLKQLCPLGAQALAGGDRLHTAKPRGRQEVGTDVCEALGRHARRKGVDGVEPGTIRGMSSGRAAGSSPSRFATHFTADRRSRRRVAESLPGRSSAASMDARVIASPASLAERFLMAQSWITPFGKPDGSREDRGD